MVILIMHFKYYFQIFFFLASRDNGLAWELFTKMKPADSKSYSAIISGMCTYGQLDTAWKLFEEANEKKIPISLVAYNSLLAKVNFLRESHEMIWQLTQVPFIIFDRSLIIKAPNKICNLCTTRKHQNHIILR